MADISSDLAAGLAYEALARICKMKKTCYQTSVPVTLENGKETTTYYREKDGEYFYDCCGFIACPMQMTTTTSFPLFLLPPSPPLFLLLSPAHMSSLELAETPLPLVSSLPSLMVPPEPRLTKEALELSSTSTLEKR